MIYIMTEVSWYIIWTSLLYYLVLAATLNSASLSIYNYTLHFIFSLLCDIMYVVRQSRILVLLPMGDEYARLRGFAPHSLFLKIYVNYRLLNGPILNMFDVGLEFTISFNFIIFLLPHVCLRFTLSELGISSLCW